MLHVVDEPLPVLAEIRRVLTPAGLFLLHDWIRQPLPAYLAWRRDVLKEGPAECQPDTACSARYKGCLAGEVAHDVPLQDHIISYDAYASAAYPFAPLSAATSSRTASWPG